MQQQSTKELEVNQDNKEMDSRVATLSNDEVEEFRAYFNDKMSILKKGVKEPEVAEYGLSDGASDEEEEETEDEEVEERLGNSPPPSVSHPKEALKIKEVPVQFLDSLEEDVEEEEDGLDFLKVKRRNVFGLDLKENETSQVSSLTGPLSFLSTSY